jgi:hypothetical protein
MDLYDCFTELNELDKDIIREKIAFEKRFHELVAQWVDLRKNINNIKKQSQNLTLLNLDKFKTLCPHFVNGHTNDDLEKIGAVMKCEKCGIVILVINDKESVDVLILRHFVGSLLRNLPSIRTPPRLYQSGWCYNIGSVNHSFDSILRRYSETIVTS